MPNANHHGFYFSAAILSRDLITFDSGTEISAPASTAGLPALPAGWSYQSFPLPASLLGRPVQSPSTSKRPEVSLGPFVEIGAGEQIRTVDINLGKVALYH